MEVESNYIMLLMLTKTSVENPFDKFGRVLVGAVEMLWDSGMLVILCARFSLSTVFQNIRTEIFQSRLENIILQALFISVGILTVLL